MALVNRDDPWSVARYASGYNSAVRTAGQLYRTYKAARRNFRSGNTVSRFETSLNKGKRSAPDMPGPVSKRRRVIGDAGGYTQFRGYRYKSGKKRSMASKRASILNAVIQRQRLRYSRINDLSVGNGSEFLSHQNTIAPDTVDLLPIFMFNLTNVRQGNSSFLCPFYRLAINKTSNLCVWNTVSAVPESGTGTNTDWIFEDAGGHNECVGRKSFLDWARIRLTLWGKQNSPGSVTLSLVTLPDEEYCPEFQSPGVGVSKDADAFWKQRVVPLINNPASGIINNVNKRMKVHKSWTFKFDPIQTTEADQDPHCKFFDLFHRIGRIVDYTVNQSDTRTNTELNLPSAYQGGNLSTSPDFGNLPKYLNKSLYFMITSMQQDKTSPTPTKADTCSFDFNFQVCHRTVQPAIV